MEEARGETFLWNEIRENFIKDFKVIPKNKKVSQSYETNKNIYTVDY